MELAPERLAAELERGPLQPAYLVAGAETLRVLEAADAVRAAARADGVSEREVFEVSARDFDWAQLDAAINAPSLFASRRLMELRMPTGKPGKDGEKLITAFCEAPPPDVMLLVTCDEWSNRHGGAWSQSISRIGRLAVAWPIKPHELADWVERRMHARGLSATREAVLHLAERVQGNLLAAAQEIDKLALLDDGQPLDAARMDALVADAARFDVFRLVDAAMNGQAAQVTRMLHGLRAEGEAVPALLGMVGYELLRAAALARVQAQGGNLGAAFKAQRIWDSKQAAWTRALRRHPAQRWDAFVAELGQVDRSAKGRGQGDAWLRLERLLLAVADRDAAPALLAAHA